MTSMTDVDVRPDEAACELLAGTEYGDLFDAPTPALDKMGDSLADSRGGLAGDPRVDPRFVARLDDVARELRRRSGRKTALLAVVAVVAVVVAIVAASGLFAARQIDVRGNEHASADDVRRAAGVHGAPSMLRLDTAAVARRVERLPWVADARVSISWPNTLVIHVTEWQPVAYMANHGRWALLASSGRVLDDVLVRPAAYVKVVGVHAVPRAGATINDGAAVEVIDRLPERLRRQVIGLDLGHGGVTLRLTGALAVRLGDAGALAAKTNAALAVLGADHAGCRYIDVSVPSAPVCG